MQQKVGRLDKLYTNFDSTYPTNFFHLIGILIKRKGSTMFFVETVLGTVLEVLEAKIAEVEEQINFVA